MDPDEVSRLVLELKLTNEAKTAVVDVTDSRARDEGLANILNLKSYVVGKIFASRVVNRENLRVQLPRILQTRYVPDIEIVGDNIFMVVFACDSDRRHALVDGPWHFFDNLMLFKEPKGLEKPTDVQFTEYTTWIQCHNLPIVCMNSTMIRAVASHVGRVEEIDIGEGGNCLGQYARARVTRALDKPLQRCVQIKGGSDGEMQLILI